jgi:riboflavin kinase, archaea type
MNGVIFSDLAQASYFMGLEWVQQALKQKLGFAPYPATLNLRPCGAEDSTVWQNVQQELAGVELPAPNSGACSAQLFFVEIARRAENGGQSIKGAVVLPDVPGYPKDKIEVVAPVRLKDAFGVDDGDQLTLEFIH